MNSTLRTASEVSSFNDREIKKVLLKHELDQRKEEEEAKYVREHQFNQTEGKVLNMKKFEDEYAQKLNRLVSHRAQQNAKADKEL